MKMRKSMVHGLSLLLAVVMLVSCLPMVFAAESATNPSDKDPTEAPTETPAEIPTEAPTEAPTEVPIETPTADPTESSTETPTEAPSEAASEIPTESATDGSTEPEQTIPFELNVGDTLIPARPDGPVPFTLPTGSTITIESKEAYTPRPGGGNVDFYWYSQLMPHRLGPYYTYSATIFHLSGGRIGYCLQPMLSGGGNYEATAPNGPHIDADGWPNAIYKQSKNKWITWNLDHDIKNGVFLTMAYGAPNNGDTSDTGIRATALCVWDMVTGYRNPDGTERGHGTPPFYAVCGTDVRAKYDELLTKMSKHKVIPSFTAKYASQINAESTISLTQDPADGLYKASAYDSNGVLESFHFSSNISGLTFQKDGNTLHITATHEAALQLNNLIVRSRGHHLGEGTQACTVFQDAYNGATRQKLIVLDGPVDPVPCAFKLEALMNGTIRILKNTNTGRNLEGWKFEIVNLDGNVVTTITTDSSGVAVAEELPAGDYIVREIGSIEGWKMDTADHTVTVVAGSTADVEVLNEQMGRIQINKTALYGNAEGWHFEIWNGSQLIETLTTDSSGHALSSYLLPGSYQVKEVHDRDETYWTYDVEVQKNVTVTAGTNTEVQYTNTQSGLIQIIKTLTQEGTLEGWQFKITDNSGAEIAGSPFTTDAEGKILTGKLAPGTYIVEEIIPENSLYYCTSENPQSVTVTAGETAAVAFENALRSGNISILKTDHYGNPLAGAQFVLQYSTDGGRTWQAVFKSETLVPGGCFSPDLDANGSLTSGPTGKITFDGLYPSLRYKLTEVAAPAGFQLLADTAWEGELPVDGLTVSLKVVNQPTMQLPNTGSRSSLGLTLSLGLCLALLNVILGVLIYQDKRK